MGWLVGLPPAALGSRIAAGVISGLVFAASPAGVVFYKRRRTFPIVGRGWKAVLVLHTAFMLYCLQTVIAVSLLQSFPNQVYDFFYSVVVGTASSVFTLRAWKLLWKFKLTEKVLLINKLQRENQLELVSEHMKSFWIRHRHAISAQGMRLMTGVHMGVWILVGLILFTISKPYNSNLVVAGMNALAVLEVLLSLAAGITMRHYAADGFHIKTELKFVAITTVIAIVLYEIFVFSTGGYPYYYTGTFFVLTIVVVYFSTSIIMPIVLSIRQEISESKMTEGFMLEAVLKDPIGFDSFLAFAESEFSTENVLFWRELEKLRAQAQDEAVAVETIVRVVREIDKSYIDPAAPTQVNLSFNVARGLKAAMADLDNFRKETLMQNLTPWWTAETEVFELMRKDSFRRYRLSHFFQEYQAVRKVEKLSVVQQHLSEIEGREARGSRSRGATGIDVKRQSRSTTATTPAST